MEIDWFDITAPPDWPDAPLQQSLAYGQAMVAHGARVRLAVLGGGMAHALILSRPGLRLISRGPVFAQGVGQRDRVAALRRLARHPGLTLATPDAPLSAPGLIPLITPRHHAIWDLCPDPQGLRAGMAGKWRNRLKAAEGLRIERGAGPVLSELIRLEAAQRQARGYRALPGAFVTHWRAPMVWQWRNREGLQAGMVFLRHGRFASYHLGWASAAARAAFAHGPMLWQAALDLRGAGVTRLDLGAVDAANPGLARFKLGCGARLEALGASLLVAPA